MASQKPELFQLLKIAEKAVSVADEILLRHFGQLSTVEHKDRAGLVTNADRESEQAIVEVFRRETPEFGILAEEASHTDQEANREGDGKPCWVIDPLDGTTNYVHGLPIFCISIGLEVANRPQLGVISAPKLRQSFTAIENGGAFCNGEPLRVSQTSSLSDSLLATGFSVTKPELLGDQVGYLEKLIASSRGIRRCGAAAYDLAMVASGTFEAYLEAHLSPWDTSAGSLLVQEAGGRVSQYDGGFYTSTCNQILASNSKVHTQVMDILKRY